MDLRPFMNPAPYAVMEVSRSLHLCMYVYVWLCMYGYVCMAMYVWLCMYGYVCMAMYVWLCMYGYICMAMYVWLCMHVCMYVCMTMYDYLCVVFSVNYRCLCRNVSFFI